MKKRWIILAGGSAVMAGGLAIWGVLAVTAPPIPEYNGRNLSAWVKQCESENGDETRQAQFVIGRMGSNAVPYLMHRLRREAFKTYWLKRMDGWFHTGSKFADMNTRRVQAVRHGIGGVGDPAIPELEKLIEKSSNPEVLSETYLAGMAILSLKNDSRSAHLTLSHKAVGKVIPALTWPEVRTTYGTRLIGVEFREEAEAENSRERMAGN